MADIGRHHAVAAVSRHQCHIPSVETVWAAVEDARLAIVVAETPMIGDNQVHPPVTVYIRY